MCLLNIILQKFRHSCAVLKMNLHSFKTLNEFVFAMKPHEHMLLGSSELEYVQEDGYSEMWNDFWSDYV